MKKLIDTGNSDTQKIEVKKDFAGHFRKIYGEEKVGECMSRLNDLIQKYESRIDIPEDSEDKWSEEDSILITYGDVLRDLKRPSEYRLDLLEEVLGKYVGDAITSMHILPFFPSSSDAGFSVIDYKEVRPDLGSWENIEHLSEKVPTDGRPGD
ncbi:MAG: hypothetical protein U5K69_19865 [Balneolaceae bacterium]|nr:hypothetical protein [Balneolaceae bacterium]